MTCIASRNGFVAADRGITAGGGARVGTIAKIVVGPKGIVGAACGTLTYAAAFLAWVESGRFGAAPASGEQNEGVVFEVDGSVTIYENNGSASVRADYYAFGSGTKVALGALHAGASAAGAIEAAITHDDGSYGGVDVLQVGATT